jgi:uroporphyrinogen decarboxylase
MMTAMRGGVPDRVPCSPDTNWTIPAKRVGGKFWDVYYYGKPPIWKAYNDCVRYFGVDGFSHHGTYSVPPLPGCSHQNEIVEKNEDKMVVKTTFTCPAGALTQETTFLHDEPPTPTKKFITDFKAQFECAKYLLLGDVEKISFKQYFMARDDLGDDGVTGLCMNLPTLLTFWRQPTEAAFYDYYDHKELLDEFIALWTDQLVLIAQKIIDHKVNPDFVFFPNSGMLTLQSEAIMREYSIPALKILTRMFKQAGILTSLHCCGKERLVVECAAETDLDCIDPLEIAPMGDCDLKEIKEKFGGKLALKGNLHTSQVMLAMNADDVEREAVKCLHAAKEGGGFILGTGDQCGRDTPEENIFRLVEVCKKHGVY